MATNSFYHSDLYGLYNIVQSDMILYPKELVVATLRDFFSRDSNYHYAFDEFGYPKNVDLTDVPSNTGYTDNITTRLYIGESFHFSSNFFPAIIVRHGGSTSTPISFNRETGCVQWGNLVFEDGYGNIKTFPNPEYFIFAGAWEGSINIDILARDLRSRDDLVELTSLLFTDLAFNDLVKSGLIVKNVSAGAAGSTQDRNDYIFNTTITLQIRSEWRRQIPISNLIEIINASIEFARTNPPPPGPIAQNLTINTSQTLMELLASL